MLRAPLYHRRYGVTCANCVHFVCLFLVVNFLSSPRMAHKGRKPRVTSAYQSFIKATLAQLKKEQPAMEHRERFQRASQMWADYLHANTNRALRGPGSR